MVSKEKLTRKKEVNKNGTRYYVDDLWFVFGNCWDGWKSKEFGIIIHLAEYLKEIEDIINFLPIINHIVNISNYIIDISKTVDKAHKGE